LAFGRVDPVDFGSVMDVVVAAAGGPVVVAGVHDLLVHRAPALQLVVDPVVAPAQLVMACGPRGRRLADQLAQEPPEGPHRNGL
jgi:hypothetical protein